MRAMTWSKWEDSLGFGCLTAVLFAFIGFLLRPDHDGESLSFNTIMEATSDMAMSDFNLMVTWTISGLVVGTAVGAFLFVKRGWLQKID